MRNLHQLNLEGLIPGPQETETDFYKRVDLCLNIKNDLKEKLPLFQEEKESIKWIKELYPKTQFYYDIRPSWTPLFFSNYQLYPWHGGCAWIFQLEENGPTSAFFQLRQKFRNSKKYLGWYKRDELIAHEMAHVGRMMFAEPGFEELLAYRASNSVFHRWCGPIAKSNKESMLFVISLILIVIVDFSLVAMHQIEAYRLALYVKLLPLLLLGLAIGRLFIRHHQLNRCIINLKKIFNSEETANAITYRLTDFEITHFGKWTKEKIVRYINENSQKNFRLRFIKHIYFSTNS
jgi:hypothetical protein